MGKYNRQHSQPFDTKTCEFSLRYYDDTICVSFEGMPMKIASDVGTELVSQMICGSYEVDWNMETLLWLTDVDCGILNGFGTEDGLAVLLQDICRECGYIATCKDMLT